MSFVDGYFLDELHLIGELVQIEMTDTIEGDFAAESRGLESSETARSNALRLLLKRGPLSPGSEGLLI